MNEVFSAWTAILGSEFINLPFVWLVIISFFVGLFGDRDML